MWIVFSVATGPNRLIDRVVETRREVCFAPPAPSRLSTWLVLRNYYQLLSLISSVETFKVGLSLKIRLTSIFIFNKFLLPSISPIISAKGVPTQSVSVQNLNIFLLESPSLKLRHFLSEDFNQFNLLNTERRVGTLNTTDNGLGFSSRKYLPVLRDCDCLLFCHNNSSAKTR